MTPHRCTDVSLQLCPCCNGEGTIYHGTGWDGDYNWSEPCEECEGTGGALVPVELIDFDDLKEME